MNERPTTFDRVARRNIEDEIERLIGLLDVADTDPDLEDDELEHNTSDEEHSTGWSDEGSQASLTVAAELEPELGWTEEIDQVRRSDRDLPSWLCEDGEPLLGWRENAGMGIPTGEPSDDCEEACEDEGADIQAQPHDATDEGNDEPNLGRLETVCQLAASYTGVGDDAPPIGREAIAFTGEGYGVGKQVLRSAGIAAQVRTAPALPVGRYVEKLQALPDGSIFRAFVAEGIDPFEGDWRRAHYQAALERGRTKPNGS